MRERFRESLIAHMDAAGIGATALSKATKVPKTLIDKLYQRKAEKTNVEDAIRLAAYFGKTVNQLVGLEEDPETTKITGLLSRLPPEQRALIQAQLEGLVAHQAKR